MIRSIIFLMGSFQNVQPNSRLMINEANKVAKINPKVFLKRSMKIIAKTPDNKPVANNNYA